MRPILLDTNAYTAFKTGKDTVINLIQMAEKIAISSIVLGELLGGFDCGAKAKQNREELQKFLGSPRVIIYAVTADTANFYSHIYSVLRRKGKPIPSNDLWIAAQAFENGCVLCSFDQHFSLVDGLVVGTSAEELFI